ncbi:MAG: hypothetical protein AAFZ46_12250 [Pseudomonadota bacterium]
MAYAEKTKVPVSQSKGDIEKLVNKYSRDQRADFAIMQRGAAVQIAFVLCDRNILFRMLVPEDPQQERSMWRALLLTIKGKLESAERGIETFEDAFLANIVMPDGRTVSETTLPAIESSYRGNDVPLLPSY